MIKEYLSPIYDSAKSFYDKAYTKERFSCYYNERGENVSYTIIKLYSYDTLVCTIYKDYTQNKKYYYLNYSVEEKLLFSKTTLRHIKEFLKRLFYYENIKISKKDIIKNNYKELNIEE